MVHFMCFYHNKKMRIYNCELTYLVYMITKLINLFKACPLKIAQIPKKPWERGGGGKGITLDRKSLHTRNRLRDVLESQFHFASVFCFKGNWCCLKKEGVSADVRHKLFTLVAGTLLQDLIFPVSGTTYHS